MIEKFIKKVCEYFDTTPATLKINRNTRYREYITIRQFIFLFLRNYTKLSFREIGLIYNKNHSTVLYNINEVKNLLETDKKMQEYYKDLDPIAYLILKDNIISVKRRFKIDEIYTLIELCFDEETANDFMNFYKDNSDINLK